MTTEQHSVPRRLRRRSDERVMAGVASGLGDYFNVDPLLIRIALVASIVFGGLGIFLYVAAWLLVPDESSDRSIAERLLGGAGIAGGLVGGLLVLIGALVFIGVLSDVSDRSGGTAAGAFFALLAIVAGAILLRRRGSEPAVAASTDATATQAAAPPAVPRVRRPPSPLGWYAIGAALVGIGALALADTLGNLAVTPAHYAGLTLGVIGAGLVVATWWGHARWLIVLGVLLLPFAWGASLIDVPLEGEWGSQQFAPASADDVLGEYRLAGGELTLDFTRIDAADSEPIAVTASVAMGELLVLLPDDATAEVDASVGGGRLRIMGASQSGTQLEGHEEVTGEGPRFVLDLAVGIGDVRVDTRASEGR